MGHKPSSARCVSEIAYGVDVPDVPTPQNVQVAERIYHQNGCEARGNAQVLREGMEDLLDESKGAKAISTMFFSPLGTSHAPHEGISSLDASSRSQTYMPWIGVEEACDDVDPKGRGQSSEEDTVCTGKKSPEFVPNRCPVSKVDFLTWGRGKVWVAISSASKFHVDREACSANLGSHSHQRLWR